jgi:hypothetical protein
MKMAVAAVLACLAPSFGLAATMTGSTTVSSAAVDCINMQAAALAQAATPQTNGSSILTWQPPAANEDGSTLTDLAGYRVYWGTTPGTYSTSTQLNATSRTHTVTGLARGTWYFVVTALNSQGVESSYSNVWSKTVP